MPRPANPGPPYRRGSRPSADGWNRQVELSGPISVEPPLYATQTGSGVVIRLVGGVADASDWFRISGVGSGGGYSLIRVNPASDGTWTDATAETVPGGEANFTPDLPVGTIVRAWLNASGGLWVFLFGGCY